MKTVSKTANPEDILQRARPVVNQHAHEIQPFGHLARLPIALAELVCKQSVDNLNQLLADTMTLRDLYKKPGCRETMNGFRIRTVD